MSPAGPSDRRRPAVGHLDVTPPPTGERFDLLLDDAGTGVRVVHIVSTPPVDDGRYDQDDDELVVVLAGAATLEVDGVGHELVPGAWAWLPAHTPHRLTRCAPGTRWLAVHLPSGATDPTG